jgi:DNA invertase Pin-like site-specific DNA recombinase
MNARYVRISTPNQNLERQLRNESPNEEVFIDVCSGSIPFNEKEEGRGLLSSAEGLKISHIAVYSID